MRELQALSKQIKLSREDQKKFQAALADKTIEFKNQDANVPSEVIDKIRKIEEAAARKSGFIK